MRRYLALSLSVLMVASGCASHTARPVLMVKIADMPFSRTENSVTVAVDPYVQPDRQKEVFDAELKKFRVLPIQVYVENSGDKVLSIDDIALELPDGRRINPADPETVARRFEGVGTLGLRSSKEEGWSGPGGLGAGIGVLAWALILIPVALADEAAGERAMKARIADYTDKELREVVLSKNSSMQGFVYFLPPAGTLWYTKARLALRFADKTKVTSFIIRVPLSDSGLFRDKKRGEVQY